MTGRRQLLLAALLAGAGLGASSCSVPTSFSCTTNTECGAGICVGAACAFPSGDCESGLRYGALSPPRLAGLCVGEDELAEDSGTGVDANTASSTDSMSMSTTLGDGDPGDGDPSTGDGDPTTGDGDPTTGDGDPTTGDGDGEPPIPDTAIAHYSFDDLAGATIFDATANGFDAMMDNNQSTAAGVVGEGLAFGSLDRVLVPEQVLMGQSAFTVEFYMKTTQLGGARQFMFYYGTADTSPEYLTVSVEYANNPVRTPRVIYTGFNNTVVGLVGTTDMGLEVWHHVALTVGGQGIQIYVDHFIEASDPFNPQSGVPGYAWIQIGGAANGFGSFMGVLDELRFSEGELSTNEMLPPP